MTMKPTAAQAMAVERLAQTHAGRFAEGADQHDRDSGEEGGEQRRAAHHQHADQQEDL
ncbi:MULTISPECIES: hypothetical protein [Roseomonadaceae]|uniref:Uncharacterized protein n=1 Tax=Falsiroseomonas oleicola TaxID=2801474 RepID=A0ABS6H4R8_9PROT|nr:hypothetical protein [Roseomonas oleicola]MBU8542501.1 hypothetical protein [Roseomonas oleicola]